MRLLGIFFALCASIGGAQISGDIEFLGTRCCVPQLGICTTGLPLCASLGCCDPRFMSCPPGVSICSYDPSVLCCNEAITKCPSGAPICGTPTMTPAPGPTCCDPSRQSCSDFGRICPGVECCDSKLNQCPTGFPTCFASSATITPAPGPTCCDPSRQSCSDFSRICPEATCCNSKLNQCPAEAPICGIESPIASPNNNTQCCDPSRQSCSDFSRICPGVECCDSKLNRCPTGFPTCFAGTVIPSPRASDLAQPCCNPENERCPEINAICPTITCCNSALNTCPKDGPICGVPSQRPIPSTSSYPTRRPAMSAAPTPRPTTMPIPTRFVRLQPSPAPSRWPEFTPRPMPSYRPMTITSTLNMIGANKMTITRPEKLQEMVIQIGCTLRMPVENVVIQSIYEIVNGVKTDIPFDKSVTGLNNNGEIQCLKSQASTYAPAPAMRRLQSGHIGIDYVIYDPSDDLVVLSSTEFTNIVSSSSALQSYSASVGASAMSASAPQELASTPTTSTSNNNNSGAIIAGVVVGVFAIGGAIVIYKIRQRKPRNNKINAVPPTMVINPIPHTNNTIDNITSNRNLYPPMNSRALPGLPTGSGV